jgi:hypothetical protein
MGITPEDLTQDSETTSGACLRLQADGGSPLERAAQFRPRCGTTRSAFEKTILSPSKPSRLGPLALRAPLAAAFDAAGLLGPEVLAAEEEEAFDEEACAPPLFDGALAAKAAPAHPNDNAVTTTTRAFVIDISLVIPGRLQSVLLFPGSPELVDPSSCIALVLYFRARQICFRRTALTPVCYNIHMRFTDVNSHNF